MSFGFKYGLIDADCSDVRFSKLLPKWNFEFNRSDPAVHDYVRSPNQRDFYRHLHDLTVPILPSYKRSKSVRHRYGKLVGNTVR